MIFSLKRYWKLKQDDRLTSQPRYTEEVLSANWNPELPSLLQSNGQTEEQPNPERLRNPGENDG